MNMTVYIDVLLAVNLYLTFLLLLATEKIARARYERKRRIIASVAGAVCSLTVLLPALPHWLLWIEKAGFAILIVRIASGEKRWKPLLLQTLLFLNANAVLAGGTLLLTLWKPNSFAVWNGVVYVDLSVWTLLAATTLTYAALRLLERIRARRGNLRTFRAVLSASSGKVSVTASIDTGNSLREPFSGEPAAVARLGAVERILPEEIRGNVAAVLAGIPPEQLPPTPGVRLIPARTASGSVLLPAYGPVRLDDGAGRKNERLWLALCPDNALPQTDLLLPERWFSL